MDITTIALIGIIVYTIFCLYVGLGVGYKKEVVGTASGYFLGGGVNYVILYFTTAATWFSAWVFTGAPASFYNFGIGFSGGALWQLLILFLMGAFGIKFKIMAEKYNYITPADLLDDYYKSRTIRNLTAVSQLLFCIPYIMAQVTGIGLAVETITGGLFPYWAGVLYGAVVVGIYVYWGGFRSQAWVDTAQGIIFTIILWGSVVIMLAQPALGGFSGLFAKIETTKLVKFLALPDYFNWSIFMSFFFVQGVGGFFAPYVWQRMYAASSPGNVRLLAGTLGPFYSAVMLIPAMLIGFSGFILYPKIANADTILMTTMAQAAPLWGVLITIGVMAAGMSTLSSQLISSSSIIAVDLIKQFKPNMSDSELRNMGRYMVLVLLVAGVVFSLVKITSIMMLTNMALAGFAQLLFPVVGALFWRRATKEGAIAGMVVGFLVTIVFTYFIPHPLHVLGGFWGLLANAFAFFVVSYLTNTIPSAQIQEKFTLLQ